MDIETFLRAVLPDSGYKMSCRIRPRQGKKPAGIHTPFIAFDEFATHLSQSDLTYTNDNIYFATASYREVRRTTKQLSDGRDFTFVAGRTQDNVQAVKALWMDLDVGKPGAYETQKEAGAHLMAYCRAVGLPKPIVVNSGYGVHCYWVFTQDVTPEAWMDIASYQRAAWRHFGLKVDPACDQDCARVLRAPGTRNKREGLAPKPVKVVSGDINALPPQEIKRLLQKYVAENNAEVRTLTVAPPFGPIPAFAKSGSNLADAKIEYPESFAANIVQHCGQMIHFSQTGGETEPVWHAMLGVLKHCKDGEDYAHQWSANDHRYNADDTQAKLDHWSAGPTTCARLRELQPTQCEGCKHQCVSPIKLGYNGDVAPPVLQEVIDAVPVKEEPLDTADTFDPASGGTPPCWPNGYAYNITTEEITVRRKNDDGVWESIAIASPLFYPVEQVRGEDGGYSFRMHVWVRGSMNEFLLPLNCISNARELISHLQYLARVEIKEKNAVIDYVNKYMVELRQRQDEVLTFKQMGWQFRSKEKGVFDRFLIGDTLITRDGMQQVELSDMFPEGLRDCYSAKGDPRDWISAVDMLFNRPHGEPYQFTICAAFGSVLSPLLGYSEWNGIPFALTSDHSGFGKSTVSKIAFSIWMHQTRGTVVTDATTKAILGVASAMNNIPYLLDEVTKYIDTPKAQSDTLYALSNGHGRDGMGNDGRLRARLPGWCGISCMTSNRNIWFQLSENKLNPEATQMRVFEIDLEAYPRLATMDPRSQDYRTYNAEHARIARTIIDENYGIIGPAFIQYVIHNVGAVKVKLAEVSAKIATMSKGDATKERYYHHLVTCVLVGGYYAKKLGYVGFDLNRLRDWCLNHIAKLRSESAANSATPSDHFAAMMADFSGKILMTKSFITDARIAPLAEPHRGASMRFPIVGRYASGSPTERPQLFLTVAAIREWCSEKGLQFSAIRRDFMREGIALARHPAADALTGSVRLNLARGVVDVPYIGQPVCIEFNADKAYDLLGRATDDNVIPLKANK